MRTFLALRDKLAEEGHPYQALVAFSDTVRDGGMDYTEPSLNGMPEAQTAEAFKRDEYRFLVVANKFQTGFDQPLLHTMYVDKKLADVHAVQTLSRLNRVYPGKDETMVLDFENEAEDIQKAFQPYYERTVLSEGTDPNLLYDHQRRLLDAGLFSEDELDAFAAVYFDPRADQSQVYGLLEPVRDRYTDELDEAAQADFKSQLNDYVRFYSFLSHVPRFTDADLEKLYHFARLLARYLPVKQERLPVEIIRELNDRFGTAFTEDDKVFIKALEETLAGDAALQASMRANTPENARLSFDHVVGDRLQDMMDTNFEFYKRVTDDDHFAKVFLDFLFDRYRESTKGDT